ncbi:SpoIIE family protein phosphatase [Nocardioides sp. BP30]|uniref:SpoIIE family protein phosphatase n=1 Tax=Nocardioides sp. BP30 TaxID=3036374 RepID=UPI0024697190|nr:SpoIIE family protein phosphatase [Nocardioides sp. BP30]WGL52215.1 SpoIIE family protein phosphatase [Nocardioides sp. BP30]
MTDASLRETLASAGRVGRDLLAVDWHATTVGDPDTWPLSLVSAVRTILSSRFSMWMAWGEELTFFCNDAYRSNTLGAKYPWALGRSAREVWAEIWPEIGPRIEHVIATGEATWDEALQLFLQRSGYSEESYHTFSYSPLTDDDGTIAGMLCVVAEVTEEIVAQRRMSTLRDLGIRVSTAESVADAVRAGCEHLALNNESLPWVSVYLFDEDGNADLAGTAGIEPGHVASPLRIEQADPEPIWPVRRLLAAEEIVVEHVDQLIPDLPTGAWSVPPEKAVIVPIPRPLSATPYGFLVFGANRHRPVDTSFYEFVELIAAHFSAAITDARAMEQEKERSEALAQLDQAKSDFLANVSHELRTPLTLLLGPAEDALADVDDPLSQTQRNRVDVIARSGSRMLRLVNTLLDFSRLDAQHEDESQFELTDLADYTAQLASLFQSPMERAGLSFSVDCPEPVLGFVDRNHWSRIVFNLLSNALKFTLAGGVEVHVRQDGTDAVLSVTDTGIGILETEQSRLFERFHRVRGVESRSIEGSGIGLALVAQLVALHGGEVSVTSAVGEGSTFTVRIPQGADHLPPDQVAASAGGASGTVLGEAVGGRAAAMIDEALGWLEGSSVRTPERAPAGAGDADAEIAAQDESDEPGARATVMVVDDNLDMRRYVAGILAESYRVVTAVDGRDALAKLAEAPVDIVITDVMMPRLDGFGLLARLRDDPGLAAIPVIMVSARAGEEGTVEGLEAGADDYLVKPFSARELLARVRVNLELERVEAVRAGLQHAQELVEEAERIGRFGSWQVRLDDERVSGSRMFAELIGLDAGGAGDEDAGGGIEQLDLRAVVAMFVHAEDVEDALSRLRSGEVGERIAYQTEVGLPSGQQLTLSVRGEVAEAPPGTRVLRGSVQDVTEQRLLQQQLIATESARRAASRERAIADELQHSLLPEVATQLDFLEVATYYRPGVEGTQVGGDWYDVIDLGGGRTAIVVGDVMGRGVRAAAVMGQVKAAARAFARLDLAPTDILENLDGIVRDMVPEGIVTCVYAVHDPAHGTLTYANAGNVPPLLIDADGVVTRLAASGPPLGSGFFGSADLEVPVGEGSLLALYTDGLVERRRIDLGTRLDELERILTRHRDVPLGKLPARLIELLVEDNADDVAVVIATVQPARSELICLAVEEDLDEIGSARTRTEEQLLAWGVPQRQRLDLVLMVSELVTNAMTHGRPPVELRLRRTQREIVVEVSDASSVRARRQRPGIEDEHGRGLGIVERLADRWGSRIVSDGKVVWAAVRITWA